MRSVHCDIFSRFFVIAKHNTQNSHHLLFSRSRITFRFSFLFEIPISYLWFFCLNTISHSWTTSRLFILLSIYFSFYFDYSFSVQILRKWRSWRRKKKGKKHRNERRRKKAYKWKKNMTKQKTNKRKRRNENRKRKTGYKTKKEEKVKSVIL